VSAEARTTETLSTLSAPYQGRARQRRSQWFKTAMHVQPGMKIIDLGGAPMMWRFVDVPLDITLLAAKYWVQIPAKYFPIEAHTECHFGGIILKDLDRR